MGYWDIQKLKRQAPNALIQGTGADLTNRALYLVDERLRASGIGRAVFSIHDELLVSIDNNVKSCEEAKHVITSIMEGMGREIKLSVPLKVSCSEPKQRWEK